MSQAARQLLLAIHDDSDVAALLRAAVLVNDTEEPGHVWPLELLEAAIDDLPEAMRPAARTLAFTVEANLFRANAIDAYSILERDLGRSRFGA